MLPGGVWPELGELSLTNQQSVEDKPDCQVLATLPEVGQAL